VAWLSTSQSRLEKKFRLLAEMKIGPKPDNFDEYQVLENPGARC